MICADSCDGITKYYTSNTVYACMEEQTEDQLTAYRRLIGHAADLVTTEDAVDINRLREKAAVLERERDKLRRELDRLYGLMGDVRADHAWQEGNWATAKEAYEKRIQEQAEAINRASKYSDAQRGDIDRLTARVHELEVDHAMSETVWATAKVEYEKTIDELKARVQAQVEKIDSLLQDNLSLNAQLDDKVEQLQGAAAAGKDRLIKSLEQRARLQDSLEELIRENAELRCKLARFESLHP